MQEKNNLAMLGEFGLINRIATKIQPASGVITGIGDDAAVTATTPGMQLLTSTDMLLEGVHFRRKWHDPYRLGRKSLAVNISDMAAMGGIPRWTLLSLAIPSDYSLEFIDSFTGGFLSIASEHGITLIGGDTCVSKNGLVISVTILGEQRPDLIVRRSGARAGDDIWVTGNLGDAALALSMLEHNNSPFPQGEDWGECGGEFEQYLLSRLLNPTPRIAVGIALAESGLVNAMSDISDGIVADLGHITEQSNVGSAIRLDALPLSEAFRIIASLLPEFPWHLPLSGGEDYELAFTAPPVNREKIAGTLKKCGIDATPVGIVTTSPGVKVVNSDNSEFIIRRNGFNHFI